MPIETLKLYRDKGLRVPVLDGSDLTFFTDSQKSAVAYRTVYCHNPSEKRLVIAKMECDGAQVLSYPEVLMPDEKATIQLVRKVENGKTIPLRLETFVEEID